MVPFGVSGNLKKTLQIKYCKSPMILIGLF